jgi:hypothetical protein
MSYRSFVVAGSHSVLAISSDNFAKNKAATTQPVSRGDGVTAANISVASDR